MAETIALVIMGCLIAYQVWADLRPMPTRAEDVFCPVCGYYCLGKGGRGCIDKPSLVSAEDQ